MPTILITSAPPGELFSRAVNDARRARDAIDKLTNSPLDAGEEPRDRLIRMANHGIVLSEAFTIIDTLLSAVAEAEAADIDDEPCDCPACTPQRNAPDGDRSNAN
jgi:hypothetical protein